MQKKNRVLVVLIGPTAVGKTALSLYLAKKLGAEIVSADSRQCYKHLNIGTAKATAAEQQVVPHHLIDFLPLEKSYSAGTFEKDALRVLNRLWAKSRYAMLVGGSGLYVQAVCEGLGHMPEVSKDVMDELIMAYRDKGLVPLLQELAQKDAVYYAAVDHANPHRVLRALGVCRATGLPFSYFRAQKKRGRNFWVIKIGLNRPREVLYNRINRRVDMMMKEGLLAEAKSLRAYSSLQSLQTVGYQELFDFFAGHCTQEEAVDLIKQHSRNYAKRQLTFFHKDKTIKWFAPDEKEEILAHIQGEFLKMA